MLMIFKVALALLGVFLIKLLVNAVRRLARQRRFLRVVPHPEPVHWLWGHWHDVARTTTFRHLYFTQLVDQLGPTFLLTSGFIADPRGELKVITADPEFVFLMLSDRETFNDRPHGASLSPEGMLALLTSDPRHQAHRNLVSPLFAEKFQKEYVAIFSNLTEKLAGLWSLQINEAGETASVDVLNGLTSLTMDIIGRAGFGTEFSSLSSVLSGEPNPYLQASETLLKVGVRLLQAPFSLRNLSLRKQLIQAKAQFDGAVRQVLDAYQAKSSEKANGKANEKASENEAKKSKLARGNSILDALIRAHLSGEFMLSKRGVKDEAFTLLLAGHETTSNTLSWALYLLATNPKVQEKAAKIATEVLQNPDGTLRSVVYEDVKNLHYLRYVMEEALRLFPTVVVLPRKAKLDFVSPPIGEKKEKITFPAGTAVYANLRVLNRLKACIGRRFALNEGTVILAVLLSRFSFTFSGEKKPDEFVDITLKPVALQLNIKARVK